MGTDTLTFNKQLLEWVKGNPIHSPKHCCPDFSCCKPELLAPLEEREHFLAADDHGRMRMCAMFLGRAMNELVPDKKVYIGGVLPEEIPDE